MKLFYNLNPLFATGLVGLKNVSFVSPERKEGAERIRLSGREASCTGDKIRFKAIMKEASLKAFEHIKLFAHKWNCPGISCAIAINDEEPFVQCYGYSDIERLSPMLPETKLRIGGLCGTFTSLLLTKQANYFELLQKTIDQCISINPEKFGHIKFGQLLAHISGFPPLSNEKLLSLEPAHDLISQVVNNELDGLELDRCGSYKYSSLNLLVASAIYENLNQGKDFSEDLSTLFQELDMNSTVLEELGARYPNMGSHYARGKNSKELVRCPDVNFKHRHAAMGVLSTPTDLAKFGRLAVHMSRIDGGSARHPNHNVTSLQVRETFRNFIGDNISGSEERGRPRLGFRHCAGWKTLLALPFNGVDAEENDLLGYSDGTDVGSSSILYLKGTYINRPLMTAAQERETREKEQQRRGVESRDFPGTVVAITCNLEHVKLHQLADRVATIYEQAYKLYEDEREERKMGAF